MCEDPEEDWPDLDTLVLSMPPDKPVRRMRCVDADRFAAMEAVVEAAVDAYAAEWTSREGGAWARLRAAVAAMEKGDG